LQLRIPDGAGLRSGAHPRIEYCPSLTDGQWQALLPSSLQLSGGDLLSPVPPGLEAPQQGFFRVRFVEVP
jgi:hypothetical protein